MTLEPKPLGEKRYNAEAETSPTVRIWWKGVPFVHKDAAALDLLSRRPLRPHRAPLQGPRARQADRERGLGLGGHPEVRGHLRARVRGEGRQGPGRRWRRPIYEEIEKLQKEPVPAEELQKVKNQFKANAYRRLSSPFSIAVQLMVVRRPRRLALHQQRRREGRRGDRRRHPARGADLPHQGEPHGRRLPAQGGRGAPRTRRSRR